MGAAGPAVGGALGGGAGSTKGSKGKSKQESAAGNDLITMMGEMYAEGKDLRDAIKSNFMDILKTGGSQALNPAIARATEASSRTGAASLRELDKELIRTGQYNTPFGVSQRQSLQSQNRFAASQIGPQMQFQFLQQVLPMAANYASGQSSTIAGGLGAAVPGTTRSQDYTTPKKEGPFNLGGMGGSFERLSENWNGF